MKVEAQSYSEKRAGSAQPFDLPYRSEKRDALLAAVERLAPQINSDAEAAEERSNLSAENVQALRDAGLLSYYAPRFAGGDEVDPITNAEVLEALSRVDLCAAWLTVQQTTGGGLYSRMLPEEAFKIVYGPSPRPPIFANSIHPKPGAFTKVDGGYRLSGRWTFLSGVSHADWVTMSGTVSNPEACPDMDPNLTIAAVIPGKDVKIVGNWRVFGMKASGSFDIELDDLFVPAELTYEQQFPPRFVRGMDGPRLLPIHMGGVAMALGGARRILDEVIKQALEKKRPGATDTVSSRSAFQYFIGESELALRSARAAFYDLIEEMWALSYRRESFTHLSPQLAAYQAFVYRLGCDMSAKALRFLGSNAARLDNPIQRFHRDLLTLSLHVQMGDQFSETLGQQILGVQMVVPGTSNIFGGNVRTGAA